jgi:uncharacterized membrane protein
MNTNSIRKAINVTIAGLLTTGVAAVPAVSRADHTDVEQCAGIVKAGKNDCATSTNACHGHVAADGNPEAWIYLPKGTCERLVGGRIVHVKEPGK